MEKPMEEETRLCAWGNNMFGQLAFENPNNESTVFTPKMLSFTIHISEITCGFGHSLFRSMEGQIFAVGNNNKGQLGIGKKVKRRTAPTLVNFPEPNEKVLLAAANGHHNVVYTEFGKFYVWGDNPKGQLGTGSLEPVDTPMDITGQFKIKEDETVVQLSCGQAHSMALFNSGKSWAWGSNEFCQLGVDAQEGKDVLAPTKCVFEGGRYIAAGYGHSFWLDSTGDVYGVGNNKQGCVSLVIKQQVVKSPVRLEMPEKMKKVFAGSFSAGLSEKETLFVWGPFMNEVKPVYSPFDDFEHSRAGESMRKSGGMSTRSKPRITTVGLGENFIIAADEFGDCYSWGNNDVGQLGQVGAEDQELAENEEVPKRMMILQPFDVKGISTGPNFVYTMVNDKPVEKYEGSSVEYQNYGLKETSSRKGKEEQEEGEVEEGESARQEMRKGSMKDESIAKKYLEVSRVLVLLYENLRMSLINTIDAHIDVESELQPELVKLIKDQQDIIDNYIKRFDLKRELSIELTEENLDKFEYPQSIALAKEMANGDPGAKLEGLNAEDQSKAKLRMLTELRMKMMQKKKLITDRIVTLKRVLDRKD